MWGRIFVSKHIIEQTKDTNNDIAENTITVTNDGAYGGGTNTATLNIDALNLITSLENTAGADGGNYSFANLESRFATAGTTLEVEVQVNNLPIYVFDETIKPVSSITATIDIV